MMNTTDSVQTKSENNAPADTPYPDLSSLNRNDLIKRLYEIIKILDVLKQKIAVAQATEDEIKKLEEKGKAEAEVMPNSWNKPIAVSSVISAGFLYLLICIGDGSFDGWFLGTLIWSVILFFFIRFLASNVIYPIKCSQEVDAKYQVFANEHIAPKQALLNQQLQDINEYLNTDACQWAGNALPEKYFPYPAIQTIIQYLQSCRADTLKEAINLYEEELHRMKMEDMQQQIVQSTAQTANEVNRQSSLLSDLQKTAKDTNTSVKIGNLINILKD